MVDYDLNELVAGTVDSITEKFEALSDGQLATLREMEAKSPTKRKTLLDAIDAETKRRTDANNANDAKLDDEMTPGSSNVAGDGTSTGDAIYTQADMDTALATQKSTLDSDHALKLANAVAAARKEAPKPTKPAVVKPAAPLSIAKGADSVATVALTAPTQVVFVGTNDVPLAGLTPMTFGASDYEPNGNGVVLKRDVEFPTTLQATEVSAAFVTGVDGKPIGRAELVMPFGIGGGRQAKLPSGTLAFA